MTLSNYDRLRCGLAPELAALEAKRAANVEAKDAASEIKLNYDLKPPPGFQKRWVGEQRAKAAQALTAEQVAERERLDQRRSFVVEARRVFMLADVDKSLALDYAEVERFAMTANMTEAFIAHMDGNRDGRVQLAEWVDFLCFLWEQNATGAAAFLGKAEYVLRTREFLGRAEALFDLFDLDGNGKLDWQEVVRFTRRQGADGGSEAQQFFAFIDADRSGFIERAEWREFVLEMWNTHGPQLADSFVSMLRGRSG
jgi:Ca2+-binding EF-hand superfamily protein